ncbi:MAG: RNA-binding protein [Bacteroidia bacterium]|jgi:RNA recognition motif-containing protein|nr:RNA-binding protein [Bacteroidia bacterium]
MNIFVSNISFKVRENSLRELFSQYGTVERVKIVKDRETQRSKGYGFVEMPNDDEARRAIEALNGYVHFERPLIVSEARGRQENANSSAE